MAQELSPLRVFDFRRQPESFAENVLFTRESEASYYGSDRLLHFSEKIQKATTQQKKSLSIAVSGWNNVGITSSVPGNIISPDNASDAIKLVEKSNVSGEHRLSQSATVTQGDPVTISVFVKAGTKSKVQFSFMGASSFTGGNPGMKFDLSSGKLISKSSNVLSYEAISSGNNWWLLKLTALPDLGTSIGLHIYMLSDSNSISYSGDSGKYVYAWGAKFENTAPIVAAAAAIAATPIYTLRYNYDLSAQSPELAGALVEPESSNLVPYSQLLSHTLWRKQYAGIILSDGKAPDGSSQVFKIREDSSKSCQHYVTPYPTITASIGSTYTFSMFLKAAERKWAYFNINGVTIHFDLTNGVVGTKNDIYTSNVIEDAGNGWFRCSATFINDKSGLSAKIGPEPANASPTYNGDGNSGILAWGAQLEKNDELTSYIRTEGSDVVRKPDSTTLIKPSGTTDVFVQRVNGGFWINGLNSDYRIPASRHEVQAVNFYKAGAEVTSKTDTVEAIFPYEYETLGVTNTTVLLNGITYNSQTPNKDWSLLKAVNKTSDVFRFQVNSGDQWSGDATNAKPRQRCELYSKNANIQFNSDVWMSFAIRIVPGERFQFTSADWCYLGQFHATEDKGDKSVGPVLGFRLEGADTVNLYTASSLENPIKTDPKYFLRGGSQFTRGVWHTVVVRMRFSPTNGQLQWWQNGREIGNVSGIGMGYVDVKGPYWKFGIYRSPASATLAVEYANMELETGKSLSSRVLNPLPIS